ncbi:stage II sporulation protein E [Thermoanaerobacterium thermosaccharolyticum]|uniref:stage II sporulation protein E n=1 Tax=Thermoanaerobacterium thermosaccharolyticum TaxID=1517 RepID=UPI00177C51E9|nr:stage II sporulation protein E [Thermoanaerobacterium thermosaccharolyticum]MBE0068815.1 stage II sporulation protein E [Thermoanaerobacterium thermosaccharolyticum]MBE0229182.1 stage II sporulation protein E [Thermoanaerobacterium thermosaccharolyticum]MCP2240132.1 stage II sporulation protein E [Thermoanaerobacterium thermosaccharolyticum]
MQSTEILPYSRIGRKENNEKIQKDNIKFAINSIIFALIGFVIGRAQIMDNLLPFGVAYFASLIMLRRKYFISGIGIYLGTLTLSGVNSTKYLFVFILILLFESLFKVKSKNIFKVSLITFLCLLTVDIIYSKAYGFLLFDIMTAIYESIIAMLMIFIFNQAISLLSSSNRKVISNEELISLCILLGILILGLNNIKVWRFTLNSTVGILIILMSSYIGGVGTGASVGTTIGLIGSLSLINTPTSVGLYGFAGLLSGSMKKLSRIGIVLGFLVAAAIMTFYVNAYSNMLINPYDLALSSALFLAVPKKHLDKLLFIVKGNKDLSQRNYNVKLKEVVTDKLKEYSEVFDELGKSFKKANEKILDHKDISYLFEEIANKTCTDCAMYKTCWDKDFYFTYKSMFDLVESLEGSGNVENNKLYKRCIRFPELLNCTKHNLQLYKINMQWRERLKDAKNIISNQLKGISTVISNMADDISMNITFKDELEQYLMVELDKRGISVDDVIVYDSGDGNVVIKIYKKACYAAKECERKVIPAVSEIMGEKYERKNTLCSINNKGRCGLTLTKAESYQVSTGISKVSKSANKISGDTYSFMELEGGKYMAALSDGMGFGYRAASESSTTISLLERFIEAGFDKGLVVQTLNSILALRSAEEMFSTVDISFIDLFTGDAEFIKIGASATFIKSGRDIDVIESSSLPIGILEDVDADIHDRKLKDGDFVILATDGVLDCFGDDKENNMSRFLKDLDMRNPQDMAEVIMKKCLDLCGNAPKDDMTVLVIKIWKRHV